MPLVCTRAAWKWGLDTWGLQIHNLVQDKCRDSGEDGRTRSLILLVLVCLIAVDHIRRLHDTIQAVSAQSMAAGQCISSIRHEWLVADRAWILFNLRIKGLHRKVPTSCQPCFVAGQNRNCTNFFLCRYPSIYLCLLQLEHFVDEGLALFTTSSANDCV